MLTQIAAGLALIVLAGLYWLQADAIPNSPMSGSVGADGLPKLLALALCVLSLVYVVQSILVRRSTIASDLAAAGFSQEPEDESDADAFSRRGHLLAAVLLVITILYAAILPFAGYTMAMALLLAAVGVFYNRGFSLGIAAFAIVGAVVFHLIFITLLGVRMPQGVWPDLMTSLSAHVA